MEFDKDPNKTPKSSRHQYDSTINSTILSTPRPQATSTVERKTYASPQYADLFAQYRQQLANVTDDTLDSTDHSSLGLVNDISTRSTLEENDLSPSFDPNKYHASKKRARDLLQRISENEKQRSLDTNKENDVNSQNLSDEVSSPTLINSDTFSPQRVSLHKEQPATPKISINSVNFEPNEITARSSVKSKSGETSPSKYNGDGFSFSSTAAELMAKFSNEDFISGSRMNSQLSADEVSWQQNFNPIPPTTEKERLEFSCFSGIIGELDLSVDSVAGHKVSVGEFFKRKCGAIGELSTTNVERPNFGFEIKSPKRLSKPGPLVNVTTMTDASMQLDPVERKDRFSACTASSANETRDEEPLISLSGIARALDSSDKTPRSLVDQLLEVKKKEKQQKERKPLQNGDCTGGTYTLVSARSSLPVFSLDGTQKSTKLSLDSKTLNRSNSWSIARNSVPTASFQFDKLSPTKYTSDTPNVTPALPASPFYNKESIQKLIAKGLSPEKPENELTILDSSKEVVKPERSVKREINLTSESLSDLKLQNTTMRNPAEKLSIGRNAEGIYRCMPGVARDADIEIVNRSDRWLTCTLSLHQIQGDRDNIHLEIPNYTELIEPSKSKIVKVGVKLLKATGPILAALNINCDDMTTREIFTKQHMMCFIPSDVQIDVVCPKGHNGQLNFSVNNGTTELPVTLHSKYDTDIPLEISITNNAGFDLKLPEEKSPLILKANEKAVIDVQLKAERSSTQSESKLIIRVHNELNNGPTIATIPLIITDEKDNDEMRDSSTYLRCDTPQQQLVTSLPSSPHSVSSSTSAGTSNSNKSGRTSPRSLASGVTVASDTIPIRSTHSSLAWTTVRVGKHETKEFTIRNTSNNKIKLQVTIVDSDKSFKLVKDTEISQSTVISLPRMGCKSFTVVYSPTGVGTSAGKIVFTHYDNKVRSPADERDGRESKPSKNLMLYGCGGYARVSINQALKIIGDQMLLSLGKLGPDGTLTSTMQLENSGDLPAYAKITLTPKAVYPTMETSWHVEPTEFILGPKQSQWINIVFKPRREDMVLLHGDGSNVGALTITHGDEPTRWRIRRLYKKLVETGNINKREHDVFRDLVYPICKIFPGETPIPNLSIVRDSLHDLGVLCRNVNRHVVTLMMEMNSDDTISIFTDDADESQMFQSLCSDTSVVLINENSYMPSDSLLEQTITNVHSRVFEEEFTVAPSVVTLTPPGVREATIVVASTSSTAQPFETKVSHTEYLSVLPAGGMIPARRGALVKVHCKNVDKNFEGVLQIFTNNDRKDVKIRVVPNRH